MTEPLVRPDFLDAATVIPSDAQIISSSVSRTLFDWRDCPTFPPLAEEIENNADYVADLAVFEGERRIDYACWQLSHSPTMQAMIDYFPGVVRIPIVLKKLSETLESPCRVGVWNGVKRQVQVNYRPTDSVSEQEWYPGVIAHELGHAWQDVLGLLSARDEVTIFDHIALRRAFEAYSSVLCMTAVCEIAEQTGDDTIIKATQRRHRTYRFFMDAFMQAVNQDPQSLWDGRAQSAGFRAYIAPGNLKKLKLYDEDSCKFERKMIEDFGDIERDVECKGFIDLVAQLFSMPYKDPETGALVERPHFNTLADQVTRHTLLETMDRGIRREARAIEELRKRKVKAAHAPHLTW